MMEPHSFDQVTHMFTPALWMILNALVLFFGVLATGVVLVCLGALAWHCCLGLRDGLRARARRSNLASPRLSACPLSVSMRPRAARFPLASRVR